MKESLFREKSLERLSSPEQLDELIRITSPRAWLGLLAIFCILASVVVWSIWGSIPTKVDAIGVLLSNGGVFPVVHHSDGNVIDIKPSVGDLVQKGEVIARIELPELVNEINSLLFLLEKSSQDANLSEYQKIEEEIEKLRQELIYRSQIISPISGRVLEINVHPGLAIRSSDPVMVLEQKGEGVMMEAVTFIPIEQGGLVKPGMDVQISPTSVHREEHGYLLGTVVYVSEYPTTPESMMQTLENEYLVSMLSKQDAPIMVKIRLIPDWNSKSGYTWSGPGNAPSVVHSGTFVYSSIVTKRERPINKVLPFLN